MTHRKWSWEQFDSDTPGDDWIELPNGDVMRVFQYRDLVREEAKVAAKKFEEARRQRRYRRYRDESPF